MTYYSKQEYSFVEFKKSQAKHKMYSGIIKNKKTGRQITINFGDKRYQNFTDKTGLNLYPELIHGDPVHRKRYRARHKTYLKDGYYSPSYFSWFFLW